MPLSSLSGFSTRAYKENRKLLAERKRKHDEIVRLWRAGQISWNEYCRQEKKYR